MEDTFSVFVLILTKCCLSTLFAPNAARGGTSQREGKSRADKARARNTGTERGGRTPSQKKGDNLDEAYLYKTLSIHSLLYIHQNL